MPSFGDSAFIFILALLLFGPKKLPELARQLGKLMAEFRRASNEFRSQMDEELRLADQDEQRKKIAAMEAAAPVTPPVGEVAPEPVSTASSNFDYIPTELPPVDSPVAEPLPIASAGELSLMPPSTGLPTPRVEVPVEASGIDALTPVLEHIPHADPVESAALITSTETESANGFHAPVASEHNSIGTPAEPAAESVSEAPVHG